MTPNPFAPWLPMYAPSAVPERPWWRIPSAEIGGGQAGDGMRRRARRIWMSSGLTVPDRVMWCIAIPGGMLVVAVWPGEPPRSVAWVWSGILFGLWVWGWIILKPWRSDSE